MPPRKPCTPHKMDTHTIERYAGNDSTDFQSCACLAAHARACTNATCKQPSTSSWTDLVDCGRRSVILFIRVPASTRSVYRTSLYCVALPCT